MARLLSTRNDPRYGRAGLEWIEASGEGVVYAITVNRAQKGVYNVALVDLAEDPRTMTRIEGTETLPIGAPVWASIVTLGDEPAVVFRPAVV